MTNKKFSIFLFICFLVFLPYLALAALSDPPIIGELPSTSFYQILLNLVDWAWKIFSVLAVLVFIYAGVMFLTAAGNESQLSTAKKAAIWGSVGIALAIVGFSIIAIVQSGLGL